MTSGRFRFDGEAGTVQDIMTGAMVPRSECASDWPSVTHFAAYYGDNRIKVIGIYQTDEGFIWREKGKG